MQIINVISIAPVIALFIGAILMLWYYGIITFKRNYCICPKCNHKKPVNCIQAQCICCSFKPNLRIKHKPRYTKEM